MGEEGRRSDLLSLVLMLGFMAAALSLSMVAVIAPRLEDDLGLTASRVGLLMSGFLFAYGLAQIPAGAAASRWGGLILAAAYAFMCAGALLLAAAGSFPLLMVARVIQGVGAGIVLPASGVVMAARIPADRLGRAWGIFGVGWGIGSIAALLILPSVASIGGVVATAVTTAAIVTAAALIALRRGVFTTSVVRADGGEGGGPWAEFRAVARKPAVNLLGLFNAAALSVGVGALAWTPSFLADEHGTSTAVAAYLTAGLGAAQIVATPAGAALAGRIGPKRTLAAAFVGMAVLTAGVPILPGAFTVFLAIVLVGFFSMMYFPPTFAQVPRVVDDHLVGLANGYVNAEGFLGSLIAPWIFGLLLDAGRGYTSGYLFLAACGVTGLIGVPILFSLLTRERASEPDRAV